VDYKKQEVTRMTPRVIPTLTKKPLYFTAGTYRGIGKADCNQPHLRGQRGAPEDDQTSHPISLLPAAGGMSAIHKTPVAGGRMKKKRKDYSPVPSYKHV